MNEFLSNVITKLFMLCINLITAKTTREKYFELKEDHEIMWTALDDIARMDSNGNMGKYAKQTINNLKHKYD
jgi:hypothetical protein